MHVLQGYALTLGACPVGLLGLAYMAVLVWAFTYPPIRGRWGSLDEGGVQVSAQRQGETPRRGRSSVIGLNNSVLGIVMSPQQQSGLLCNCLLELMRQLCKAHYHVMLQPQV